MYLLCLQVPKQAHTNLRAEAPHTPALTDVAFLSDCLPPQL